MPSGCNVKPGQIQVEKNKYKNILYAILFAYCKCTAEEILSVAKVETNLEKEGVHLSSLRTDTPRKRKKQRSETKTDETSVKLGITR